MTNPSRSRFVPTRERRAAPHRMSFGSAGAIRHTDRGGYSERDVYNPFRIGPHTPRARVVIVVATNPCIRPVTLRVTIWESFDNDTIVNIYGSVY